MEDTMILTYAKNSPNTNHINVAYLNTVITPLPNTDTQTNRHTVHSHINTHMSIHAHTFQSAHLKTPPSSSSPHSPPSFPSSPAPSLRLEMTVSAAEPLPSPPLGVFLFPALLKC